MNIVTALETLKLEGLRENHDEVIETVLSKLFIRGNEVYKAYKHRNTDFADLTDKEVRRKYITEDFLWNNTMAPEIYRELRGVQQEGNQLIHVNHEAGEDWYIVMKKIDHHRNLMEILENNVPQQNQLVEYVQTLQHRLQQLTTTRRHELEEFFKKDTLHVSTEIVATRHWAHTADDILSRVEIERAISLMERAMKSEPYFNNTIQSLSVVIDTNGENILFLDDGVSFIDVMPPKDAWRVHDAYFIICRTSADISALSDKMHADILHETFVSTGAPPTIIVRTVYEIAAGLIQIPYRKMMGRADLAKRYAEFVRSRCNDLIALIGE